MKHKKPRLGWFASCTRRSLDYERELRIKKTLECMDLKAENEKLWDLCLKQRLALSAFQKEHAQEMEKKLADLSDAMGKLAAARSELNRYRDALRRAFPSQNKEASA